MDLLKDTYFNNHTHCQAPPANATTKACQRVCLSHRIDKKRNNEGTTIKHRFRRQPNIPKKKSGQVVLSVELNPKDLLVYLIISRSFALAALERNP